MLFTRKNNIQKILNCSFFQRTFIQLLRDFTMNINHYKRTKYPQGEQNMKTINQIGYKSFKRVYGYFSVAGQLEGYFYGLYVQQNVNPNRSSYWKISQKV